MNWVIHRRKLIALAVAVPGVWMFSRLVPRCGVLDESRIRSDFDSGRTVIVNGWLMSQHEADQHARCSK